jgi:hypothetical protein
LNLLVKSKKPFHLIKLQEEPTMNPTHIKAHLYMLDVLKILILICIDFVEIGYATVNYDGSYSYTIPIKLPSGIKGVQSNLTLDYNSESPNGKPVIGWSLSDLPEISRINFENSIHNYSDREDNYSGPDGRLVKTAENDYRGINNLFIQYTPDYNVCSASAHSPCSWIKIDQFGNTWYFGTSVDSGILALANPGTTKGTDIFRTYVQKKFEEDNGNYFEVDTFHDLSTGENPLDIKYT